MPKVKRKKKASTERTAAATKRIKKPAATSPEPDVPATRTSTPPTPTLTITDDPVPNMAQNMVSTFRLLLTSHVSTHPECQKYAPSISKYMRNQFVFMGLKVPARRALQKEFLAENGERLRDRTTLVQFVECLWEQPERDFQGFGVDLLAQYRESLLGETEAEFREAVGVAEHCVVTKSWWDTVDAIAYPVVGYFVKQRPTLGVPLMKTWIDHDHMWLRRVAIIHQLSQKQNTDADLLFALCLRRAHESEFFIRKAIGWALREYVRTDKKAVKDFVEKNKSSLSPLSIREALKHC